jgi:hypothetical protein
MRTRWGNLRGRAKVKRDLDLILTLPLHAIDILGPRGGYAITYHARRTVHELRFPVATGSYVAEPSLLCECPL